VDLIGNDCKLFLRLFSFYFIGGIPWVMGVFTQRIKGIARDIIGDFLACEGGWNWVGE
jgi:hypothetical protein